MKEVLSKLAAPMLIAASVGFAGAAFAAPNAGSQNKAQGANSYQSGGQASQSQGTPPDCRKTPNDPRCKGKQ